MGFDNVSYYKPGKSDWSAYGLPTEGEERESWIIDYLEREVPTARLDEPLGQVRERARQRGLQFCPVLNQHGIILGVVGEPDWDNDPTASAEQLLKQAPTTLRPNSTLDKAEEVLEKSGRGGVPVTNSDGKLLGVFLGASRREQARGEEQLPDSEVRS